MTDRFRVVSAAAVLVAALIVPSTAAAQDPTSKSASVTKELITLLEPKLQSGMAFLAAKLPGPGDQYAGALYLQAVPQLLVVVAVYDPAVLMDQRLAKKDYREAYTDLNSASKAGTKYFFEDLMANGLSPTRDGDSPFDLYTDAKGNRVSFDGDAKKANLSDKQYADMFVTADDLYAKAVGALLAEAKK